MSQGLLVCLFALQRRFYGPRERKMGLLGFLRVGVWMSGLRAFRNGFMGNVFGEGFVLGGVFVIGQGEQVQALYSHGDSIIFTCYITNYVTGVNNKHTWSLLIGFDQHVVFMVNTDN